MAMVDYGAILKVDGKIINDSLFMEITDTGTIPPEKVHDDRYNCDINIAGNYFAYGGDKDFMMVFYKCWFFGITQEKIIGEEAKKYGMAKQQQYRDDLKGSDGNFKN